MVTAQRKEYQIRPDWVAEMAWARGSLPLTSQVMRPGVWFRGLCCVLITMLPVRSMML
jgi:hypothetical protein